MSVNVSSLSLKSFLLLALILLSGCSQEKGAALPESNSAHSRLALRADKANMAQTNGNQASMPNSVEESQSDPAPRAEDALEAQGRRPSKRVAFPDAANGMTPTFPANTFPNLPSKPLEKERSGLNPKHTPETATETATESADGDRRGMPGLATDYLKHLDQGSTDTSRISPRLNSNPILPTNSARNSNRTSFPDVSGFSRAAPLPPSFPNTQLKNFREEAGSAPQNGKKIEVPPGTGSNVSSAPTMFRSMRLEKSEPAGATAAISPGHAASRTSGIPAGTQETDSGFSEVQVYYATDRQRSHVSLADYQLSGHRSAFLGCFVLSLISIAYAGISSLRSQTRKAGIGAMMGCLSGVLALSLVFLGQTKIEKHGVNYGSDRGQLTHGIAQITIPDTHERGMVERPSLLRFELREDQTKHIVLTKAVELLEDDFQSRIRQAVATTPERDLLVFIHGYNVSFESALLRTAQLAVDLPFEGVPVCYSWPSQATLTGYPIDANNADWTATHLTDFLLDLATKTGADSINVIAHSMGNRAMTAAIRQISQQHATEGSPLFDRIVLAAPDIDADYFRRDAAPALVEVSRHVTLYASSDDQALIASRKVNGYPRAGDSGEFIVVAPGIETIDVSGTDLSLLGHSYYGDNETMLRDLYDVVRGRLPASQRSLLIQQNSGPMVYWQLARQPTMMHR